MRISIFIITLGYIISGQAFSDWSHVPILPVSQVKPGMTGVGKTIFYGDKIEEFGVEVLEVIKNFYPQRDVILVRLHGDMVEKSGVVSGMSGSPIYLEGKLAGALAYRFGQFMKEAIAGVMPIEYMIDVAGRESVRSVEVPRTAGLLEPYITAALCGADDDFWKEMLLRHPVEKPTADLGFRRIEAPLVFSGFDAQLIARYQDVFETLGFTPVAGGSLDADASESDDATPAFEPGSAIAVSLISGDYNIDASGTVTAVNGDKILAFGHFIFNLGPIQLPLARTRILATLPSLMGSNKMALTGEIVGSFRQDRLAGAFGDLSIPPKLIPVRVQLDSPVNGRQLFRLNMASDPALNNLLPFYLRIALIQALTSARLAGGLNSLYLESEIRLADGQVVKLDDFFSSRQTFGFFGTGMDAANASDLIASALGVLMVNDFRHPDVKDIRINVREVPGEKIAKIHSIWQDKTELSPGDSLLLSLRLRTTDDKELRFTRTFRIPENLKGNSLTIFISSAIPLTQYEIRTTPEKFRPVDFAHLLRILHKRRRNNNLYIQFRLRDSGLIIEGEEFSGLPPSVLKVMDSRGSSGVSRPLRDRVLFEEVIPTEYYVSGAKRLVVRIKKPPKASVPEKEEKKEKSAHPVFW